MRPDELKGLLEKAYSLYHRSEYLSPDPLEAVLPYSDPREREIAALFASSLSLGRAEAILKAARECLSRLPSPLTRIVDANDAELGERFAGFRYRFFGAPDLVSLARAVARILIEWGSLEACFAQGLRTSAAGAKAGTRDDIEAASAFALRIRALSGGMRENLIPDPAKGGASKRLHLFFRWLANKDPVYPGGWSCLNPRLLIVPVDTHMLRTARALGLTSRSVADLKTALEITEGLRQIDPNDPTRFDFSLTRLGIRPELSLEAFLDLASIV